LKKTRTEAPLPLFILKNSSGKTSWQLMSPEISRGIFKKYNFLGKTDSQTKQSLLHSYRSSWKLHRPKQTKNIIFVTHIKNLFLLFKLYNNIKHLSTNSVCRVMQLQFLCNLPKTVASWIWKLVKMGITWVGRKHYFDLSRKQKLLWKVSRFCKFGLFHESFCDNFSRKGLKIVDQGH
jgi:hypothetical protein